MRLTVLLGALLCVLLQPAEARPGHHIPDAGKMVGPHHSLQRTQRTNSGPTRAKIAQVGCSDPIMRPCVGGAQKDRQIRFEKKYASQFSGIDQRNGGARRHMPPRLARVLAEGAGRIVSHPAGCPRRAFCGCGAAVRIFGKPIRSLWLAANWFRFPRAAPAPGTVAVRRHHVFVLERHMVGSTWLVFDANSGKHRTRVHPRSIVGYVIVDPRAGA